MARTAGGHRRIERAEAIRFIRDSGLALAKPELLGLQDLSAAGQARSADDAAEALHEALRAGKAAEARGIVLSLYLGGQAVAAICDGPLAGAMRRLGELWRHDASGIFYEHRATDICLQALNQIRHLLPSPDATAPVAVGGAPAGDQYTLPSTMAATVMAAEGWREVNLGAQTPPDVLAIAAEQCTATVVWLACSADQPGHRLLEYAQHVADYIQPLGASLVIGGRAWPRKATARWSNIYIASSMAEMAAFAQGLYATREAHAEPAPTADPLPET